MEQDWAPLISDVIHVTCTNRRPDFNWVSDLNKPSLPLLVESGNVTVAFLSVQTSQDINKAFAFHPQNCHSLDICSFLDHSL